jgi:hypothetical protein
MPDVPAVLYEPALVAGAMREIVDDVRGTVQRDPVPMGAVGQR